MRLSSSRTANEVLSDAGYVPTVLSCSPSHARAPAARRVRVSPLAPLLLGESGFLARLLLCRAGEPCFYGVGPPPVRLAASSYTFLLISGVYFRPWRSQLAGHAEHGRLNERSGMTSAVGCRDTPALALCIATTPCVCLCRGVPNPTVPPRIPAWRQAAGYESGRELAWR